MQIIRLCPLAFTGLLFSPLALAQSSPDDTALVVTASKQSSRSASAQNVSSSIATGEQLHDANVTGTQKLSRVLPGLQTENSGSLLYPIISLRGVSSAQDFYNPAVTMYIDGVPQLATNTFQALTDVQSVEMLRGPQGTLYGKSAQGGIVNIVTQQPDGTPRGYLEGGVSSREGYRSKLNLSGPLQDGLLYGSVTLLRQVDNGNLRNPSTGSDNLGGTRSSVGNLRLRLAPDDSPWEAGLSLTEDCTRATQDSYLPFNDIKGRTLSMADGAPDPRLKRCTHSQSLSGKYTTENWIFNLVGAFQQQNYDRRFANGSVIASMPERWNQDVQEIRASTYGSGRAVDMVFGLYRQKTRQKIDLAYDMPTFNYMTTHSATSSETLASYGDLTWHLTDRLDLGGGLRVSHDRSDTRYHGTVMDTEFGDSNSHHDNQLLGQLSAGYRLMDGWRVYTRVAQGYKPAGFNIIPTANVEAAPYAAEKSINYEIGSRYEEDDLMLQGAVFYTHSRDMQLYSGPVGMQTLNNAGSADARGLEFNGRWRFIPGWSWDLNGNLIRSEFTGGSELYKNNKVPFVPQYSASSSVNGAINTEYGLLQPRLAVNLVGAHYFDGDNLLRQGAYVTTDFRLGWQATERLNVAMYVDNLFDRRYRTYAYLSGDTAFAQVNAGRTVGVDFRVDMF
ncbi:TonB-dependent siderophore receptor [Erwinia psidii]|uniref:TonB-dependent siderophore receptor n=1 Tax=Erwinia psidii TaxID=69224 RepID=A0A3N6RVS5_9GAMM|nr:TonB-dependent siderophore receptor [Erwinia psidii]MCX8959527.1 TonB-dependent siderophore receptor [Erwinia psidii]MCX8963174.1 TonB-dependent siderophore receptor [Erwinia psidii]MCX8966947.1 TonB-dependent siderophore receptor [Erwinia psidii]RQM36487.1 TonB-dependent siderophore receptor [Erwinia psidii]